MTKGAPPKTSNLSAPPRDPIRGMPAVLLDITAVMSIVSAIGQLRVLNTIDYSQPVVAIQSKLTELAVRRAREVRWQWLLMLPLWTPLAVVVMQATVETKSRDDRSMT